MLQILTTPDYRKAIRRLITAPGRSSSPWSWRAERAAARAWLRVLADCETVRDEAAGEKSTVSTNPRHYAYKSLVVPQFLAGVAFDDVGERLARVLRLTRNSANFVDSGILAEGERQLAANPLGRNDWDMAVELVASLATISDAGRAAGYLIGGAA